ncbi:MAG: MarR family transcriptional regulator [Kineosporiaceae bacterium]
MPLTDVTDLDMSPTVIDRSALTVEESLALGERLHRLSRLIERSMGELLADCGLTRNAWVLLSTLDAEGVAATSSAGDWGTRAGLSPSSMSAATDLLHRSGWVRRWRDPANRRSVLICLTPEGARAAQATRTVLAAARPGGGAGLSEPQLRQLSDLVARMLDAAVPEGDDAP